MKYLEIRTQAEVMIDRLIEASLSVRQFRPSTGIGTNSKTYGSIKTVRETLAMKSVPYRDIYDSLLEKNSYHVMMVDGSLLSFQYTFSVGGERLEKHRLTYFPSPKLPEYDQLYEEYLCDDIYIDAHDESLVKFPMRFDYDPMNARGVMHPASHLTLGQYTNCRVPVTMPVTPRKFILFIVRNFYFTAYKANKNLFDKSAPFVTPVTSITEAEQQVSHFII